MSKKLMDREHRLIEEVEAQLPDFIKACKLKEHAFVLMHQDAFASGLESDELFLLGKAIKYAGLMGKEVRVIPARRLPS